MNNKKISLVIILNLLINSCSVELNNIKDTNINKEIKNYSDNGLEKKLNELNKIKSQIDDSPYNKDLYIKFIEIYNKEPQLKNSFNDGFISSFQNGLDILRDDKEFCKIIIPYLILFQNNKYSSISSDIKTIQEKINLNSKLINNYKYYLELYGTSKYIEQKIINLSDEIYNKIFSLLYLSDKSDEDKFYTYLKLLKNIEFFDKHYFKNSNIYDNIINSYFNMNGKKINSTIAFLNYDYKTKKISNEDIILKLINYLEQNEDKNNYKALISYLYYKLCFAVIGDISYSINNNSISVDNLDMNELKNKIIKFLENSINMFYNAESYLLIAQLKDNPNNYYINTLKIIEGEDFKLQLFPFKFLNEEYFDKDQNILLNNFSRNLSIYDLIKIIIDNYIDMKDYDNAIILYYKLYNSYNLSKDDFYISLIKIYQWKNDTKNYIFYIEKLVNKDNLEKYKEYYKILAKYYSDKDTKKSSYYYNKIFSE